MAVKRAAFSLEMDSTAASVKRANTYSAMSFSSNGRGCEIVQRRLTRLLDGQRSDIERQKQMPFDRGRAALMVAAEHHLDAGDFATRNAHVEFGRETVNSLGRTDHSGCHRPHPTYLPPAFKRKGGAAAAQNEEQVAGFERGFRSFDKTLVKAADKSVLSRAENEGPAPPCQQRLGWRRHKKKGGTDRRRHGFRITADTGKRTLCFLHTHAGE